MRQPDTAPRVTIHRTVIFMTLLTLLFTGSATPAPPAKTCDVRQILLREPVKEDQYIIGRNDQLEKLSTVYTPHRLKRGRYEFELKRKGRDLYEAADEDLLIQTSFCSEWAVTGKDAILEVTSSWIGSRGRIIFLE